MARSALAVLAVAGFALGEVHVIRLHHKPYSAEEEVEMLSLLQTSEGGGSSDDADLESEQQGGRLPLVPLNSRFYGQIGIGSPQQGAEVIYDTGSDVAWVYHTDCKHCPNRWKFDPAKSQSLQDRQRHFTITYGTGATEGPSVIDKVAMGDLEVKRQIIGLAQDVDPMLERFPFSGVVGMSYPMENEPAGFIPIFDQMIEEETLGKRRVGSLERDGDGGATLGNQFSFFLSKQPSRWASYLFLGATPEMMAADDIVWVPALRKNQYWEVPFHGMHLKYPDGRTEQISDCRPCSGSCNDWQDRCIASIDTGHSLISGPPDFVNGFKDRVTPQDGSCTDTKDMPDLLFDMGGQHLTMKPSDYLVKMAGKCVPGIRERPPRNGHDFVFGEHLIRSFYTVFDRQKDRVGFAQSSEVSEGGLGVEHITDQYVPAGQKHAGDELERRRGRGGARRRVGAAPAHESGLERAASLEGETAADEALPPRRTLRAAMHKVLYPDDPDTEADAREARRAPPRRRAADAALQPLDDY